MAKQIVRVLFVVLLTFVTDLAAGQGSRTKAETAAMAMGVDKFDTIQYSGEGFTFVFAQAATPGGPWPRFSAKNYTREIDFNAPASHIQFVRSSLDTRGGGGTGLPIVNQTQNQFILPKRAMASAGRHLANSARIPKGGNEEQCHCQERESQWQAFLSLTSR